MGQIKIHFYTDPLCCWSWAFEQHWRKLIEAYQTSIQYQYVMCGMIPDWSSYNDPINAVCKPLQMGPVWMHASEITGVKMRYSIWHEDPPASSYPACIAVKTAGLQSQSAEHAYLHGIRRALMEDGANISKPHVLIDIASTLKGDLDFDRFKIDWQTQRGKEAFRSDLQRSKYHNIGRYPTLTFQNERGKGVIIVGYRPYDVLVQAMERVKCL